MSYAKPFVLSLLAVAIASHSSVLRAQPKNTGPSSAEIEQLLVRGERGRSSAEVSYEAEKLLSIAGQMGDPIQAIYTLPGVVYDTAESAPAVRGSSPRDNHFMVDGQRTGPLLNQLYGSAINGDLLQDFTLYPAAFPAPYGNATGAVFDVRLRDPRDQPIETVVDLNMLRTSLLFEGALSETQRFYTSYRLSTMQFFLEDGEKLDDGEQINRLPTLHDYQLRYQWQPHEQHKLTLTVLGVDEEAGLHLSEASEAGRIDPDVIGDAFINNRWQSRQLRYEAIGQQEQTFTASLLSLTQRDHVGFGSEQFYRVQEDIYEAQLVWQQPLTEWLSWQAGVEGGQREADYQYDMIMYYCTDHQQDCEANRGEREQGSDKVNRPYQAAWLSTTWQVIPSLTWEIGGRYDKQEYSDESLFAPRARVSWFVTPALELIASAGRHQQMADLDKSLPETGNPLLQSPGSDHYAAGFRYSLGGWNLKMEGYQKTMRHLPRALDPQQDAEKLRYVSDVKGTSRGIELMLEKVREDRWSGWLAVSYSQSERTDPITEKSTAYRLDTPIVVQAVFNYELNKAWTFGAVFTGRSGSLYSPIIGAKQNPWHPDYLLPEYGELNSKRLPFYHRLDVEFRRAAELFNHPVEYTMAVRNLYNRENVSGYYLLNNDSEQGYRINTEDDLGIFPYVGMKLRF